MPEPGRAIEGRRLAWWGTASLVLWSLSCGSSVGLLPLSSVLPLALPDAAARADWERIDGDYDTDTDHVRYSLFVDPQRPLLYRITQYRVSRWLGAGRRRLDQGQQTVIWNETPGRRDPLRCFAEERHGAWRTVGVGVRSSWRDVDPMTAEYRDSMVRALQIYFRAREEGRTTPAAGVSVEGFRPRGRSVGRERRHARGSRRRPRPVQPRDG